MGFTLRLGNRPKASTTRRSSRNQFQTNLTLLVGKHMARATTRAAERAMTTLADETSINPAALAYINRLSDLLFVLCRVLNDDGAADVKWVPGANR